MKSLQDRLYEWSGMTLVSGVFWIRRIFYQEFPLPIPVSLRSGTSGKVDKEYQRPIPVDLLI